MCKLRRHKKRDNKTIKLNTARCSSKWVLPGTPESTLLIRRFGIWQMPTERYSLLELRSDAQYSEPDALGRGAKRGLALSHCPRAVGAAKRRQLADCFSLHLTTTGRSVHSNRPG